MNISAQFKGIIGPDAVQYVYDRLTAVVGDFLEADKVIDAAYGDRSTLVAQRIQLETEIKLDESDALMKIQGEGKSQYVIINGQTTYLSNEQIRDAFRRTVTKDKREELAKVESQLARIDVEIARAKDKYRTAADAADSLKAAAAVQAASLTMIGKAYEPGLAVKPTA